MSDWLRKLNMTDAVLVSIIVLVKFEFAVKIFSPSFYTHGSEAECTHEERQKGVDCNHQLRV